MPKTSTAALDALFAVAEKIDAENIEAGIIEAPKASQPTTANILTIVTDEELQFLALYAIVSAARWPLDSPCRPTVYRLAQLGLVEFTDVDALYSRITEQGAELLQLTGIV